MSYEGVIAEGAMRREAMLKAIRAKCIEANPDIRRDGRTCPAQHAESFKIDCWYCENGKNLRTIRLADVLLAIEQFSPSAHDEFKRERLTLINTWNLRNDDLEKQSPETIEFIHSLICV